MADKNPQIVKDLQDSYEKYWTNILPSTEKIARVIIGAPEQPVSRLTLAGVTPLQGQRAEWSQDGAARARQINGKWPLLVSTKGKYEIELRRWPRELNQPINVYKNLGSGAPIAEFENDAVHINPVKARIKIGPHDITKQIDPAKVAMLFTIGLETGPADLSTWFIDADGTARTAYWVYIQKKD
jgi:hypothetical protein